MPFENLREVVDPKGETIKRHAHNDAIKDPIDHLDIEEITAVIDNIEQAVKENPSLLKDEAAREKIERARKRLGELLQQNPETLH